MLHTNGMTLLASAPTLESIRRIIACDYFKSDIASFKLIEEKAGRLRAWKIENSKGYLENYRVIKKGQRFRFELLACIEWKPCGDGKSWPLWTRA